MHQEFLRKQIGLRIRSGCHLKLLGDSLTIGVGSSDDSRVGPLLCPSTDLPYRQQTGRRCWASLLQTHLVRYGCTVENLGCSGITSADLLAHLDALYQPAPDTIVFCMIGSNDKKLSHGMEHLQRNLSALCARMQSDHTPLVLMTPNPATPANDAKPNRIYPQSAVVQTIRSVAEHYADQVLLIDHALAMEAECRLRGCSLEEFLQVGIGPDNDGLHPGDRGHYFYFEHICVTLGL